MYGYVFGLRFNFVLEIKSGWYFFIIFMFYLEFFYLYICVIKKVIDLV